MTITPLHGHSRPHRRATRAERLSVTTRSWGRKADRHITVSVFGEVDACNAKEFAVAVCEAAAGHTVVEVDLSGLSFLAVDGIAGLHAINAQLIRHDVSWTVVPGRPVERLLELCDPEGVIPRVQAADEPTEAEPA
ncbi:STAS domain-containing protein [Mycobacterium sp. PS03-16]|uniref:STAS domain-containing protein n=1 Tax=Mycobacterium sp. PS03-16 TaxID=2559611 RepID=UPI001ADD69C4|nr:STAS domain-containing protein [Mycobacterium sp. PS03-16]